MPDTVVPPILGIDGHAHVFSHGLSLTDGRRYTPDYDATLDRYLANVQTYGLSHGVLVQPSFLGTDNRYLLDALRQQPARLRGVVVLETGTPRSTLEEMASLGVVGMRLNLIGKDQPDFSEPALKRLLEQVAELGWHVEIHRQAEDIAQVVEGLRPFGCPVVIDHFGRPDAREGVGQAGFQRLLELAQSHALWCKVSGIYRLAGSAKQNLDFAREALPLLEQAFGSHRLVWGSDWPHTQHEHQVNYGDALAQLDALGATPELRRALLVESPAALFGFVGREQDVEGGIN